MNREVKDKWVAALRSGRYSQTIECLFDGSSYCCLGVLEAEMGSKFVEIQGREGYQFSIAGSQQDVELTVKTRKSSGMRTRNGSLPEEESFHVGPAKYSSLMEANDAGRTFAEIADAIEQNWERL